MDLPGVTTPWAPFLEFQWRKSNVQMEATAENFNNLFKAVHAAIGPEASRIALLPRIRKARRNADIKDHYSVRSKGKARCIKGEKNLGTHANLGSSCT